jgi:hypothetical protein
MNCRLVKRASTRTQVLSTEIDFGLALVKVCSIERSFGDSVRAARALAEARNIHMAIASVIGASKGSSILRRKFTKLANLLRKVNQMAPDLSEALAAPGPPDLDNRRLRRADMEPHAMMAAVS